MGIMRIDCTNTGEGVIVKTAEEILAVVPAGYILETYEHRIETESMHTHNDETLAYLARESRLAKQADDKPAPPELVHLLDEGGYFVPVHRDGTPTRSPKVHRVTPAATDTPSTIEHRAIADNSITAIDPHLIEKIARVCHAANGEVCRQNGEEWLPWEEMPEDVRLGTMMGVEQQIANPDRTPEQSHNEWMAVRRADGWTYGAKKDIANKVSPCLVAYSELPESQRKKDSLFQAIVKALSGT